MNPFTYRVGKVKNTLYVERKECAVVCLFIFIFIYGNNNLNMEKDNKKK